MSPAAGGVGFGGELQLQLLDAFFRDNTLQHALLHSATLLATSAMPDRGEREHGGREHEHRPGHEREREREHEHRPGRQGEREREHERPTPS